MFNSSTTYYIKVKAEIWNGGVATEEDTRRNFLRKAIIIGTLTGTAGIGLLPSCKKKDTGEEEVSPAEDLMREHGLLNRVLLVYDNCRQRLAANEQLDPAILESSAEVIRNFIENYHEKLEEEFIFPRFEIAGKLTDLVKVLREQHKAGRVITEQISQSGKAVSLSDTSENNNLIKLLSDFNRMYRPHESREDTILFPAFRKIVSDNEYYSLGEDFENREHQLFGEDGFESMVDKVAAIEKQAGIYELSQFTPGV